MFEIIFFLIIALIAIKLYSHSVEFDSKSTGTNDERELIVCRTELHNNQIFVWDRKTNAFMGQGNSIEAVILMLIKNHPNKQITFFGETNE